MINAPVSQRDWNSHPPLIHPPYTSTVLRGPTKPLIPLAHGLAELSGPVFGHESVQALDSDMTRNARRNGEPLGERIVVTGRVLDEDGRPVRGTLIEILAGQCGRTLRAQDRPARGAARSELSGRRALRDQRRRRL